MPDASSTGRTGGNARSEATSSTAANPNVDELATRDEPAKASQPAERDGGEHGLVDHLRAAIRQNVARRAGYRRRGGWRAQALSVTLVAHERSLLPFAALLDRQARRFQREGIPVLAADLQRMALSPPPGRQLDGVRAVPRRELGWPAGFAWMAARELGAVLRRRGFHADRFRDAARVVEGALDALALLEGMFGARFALTEHVLESIGISALNGLAYAEQSQGRTVTLSRRFAAGQVLLLPGAVTLDVLAGPVHARGVPLFIDDVPPVPFRAALRQLDDRSDSVRIPSDDVPSPIGRGTEPAPDSIRG